MKKLASNFRHPHVRLNAMGIILLLATIVLVADAISIDVRPRHQGPSLRICR